MQAAALKDADLPAVFWGNLPDDENNADLAAIRALEAESTPEERAENFKVQGNDAFKRGVQLRKDKAFWRAAQAAVRLGDVQQARSISEQARQHGSDSLQLQQVLAKADVEQAKRDAEARTQAAKQLASQMPAKKLALALLGRGWQIGRPQLHIGDRKPYLDEQSVVHWPVLFMYPEPMQMDAVEDVAETDPLAAHLDVMFPPDGSNAPEWDSQHAYQRDSLQLYYLSNAATPLPVEQLTEVLHGGWPEGIQEEGPKRYGPKAAHWIAIDDACSLKDILDRKDYVVPGVPVFFVVARDSEFQTRFLKDDLPLL
ncbi:hypothetical protein WJX73_000343 [Symbiochloris irregularis]|uniref:Cns1/TTC4 wheel domain-containing protein n=1 Tax=Symbiochloris irregularis TaxID=706552 RepID=A0AAW1PVP1_9CHLO